MLPQLDTKHYLSCILCLLFCFGVCCIFTHFYLIPKISIIQKKREKLLTIRLKEIKYFRKEIDVLRDSYAKQINQAKKILEKAQSETILNFISDAKMRIRNTDIKCVEKLHRYKNMISEQTHLLLKNKKQIIDIILHNISGNKN